MNIPEPKNYDNFNIEPFEEYVNRWPEVYKHIPLEVIETWIYRHWRDFQSWLTLNPINWIYSEQILSNEEILSISHVDDWPKTLNYWGEDFMTKENFRQKTWLGEFMLKNGTTPSPIIIARNAGNILHPRESDFYMVEPFQIIEGHMRTAYLQGLIKHRHKNLKESHRCIVVEIKI